MQLTREQHIDGHERQLAAAKQQIQEAEELRKLVNSPLFKKVILQRFCVEECARYAQLSADPSIPAEARADSLGIAQAAGHLRRWISVVERQAKQAMDSIPGLEDNLEQLRVQSDEDFEGSVETE
ncbi:hypothetical protein KMC57_gp54 [Achromobacter phage vB_AxyP_19-32_Axy24]|uniref:Uncharacterized protein n=3 Tax=Dongdastvirus TaxID=2842653 RepID=A0A514CUG6_9CAUD|nr:hypothetical protein KMC55_gp51 [Achromobacter phage vB_AxyP_19-32_Axy04]YP_010079113.1 hypothetical protein KMC56_gp54 [Achromobacter phage vB_AxyP_19-32_Axy12]YP_010079194.1 hypothetical protein KMC57_gp54 [Achromobacter phage vB_AxyP_19-32_Axy24]QDH83774.1 hypothetical protein Axy04_063 [Achromobacter phage vB_AxyP_19-32_Axy04]QDH84122.1 hypothetical protein Axy12_065 [Achromobacter phage vB_AxyP_19-32_Axy12]QDH84766.1 hypothetical protein Axy24_064 [Achromobacter phage vB_AxyP_19-32_Axy